MQTLRKRTRWPGFLATYAVDGNMRPPSLAVIIGCAWLPLLLRNLIRVIVNKQFKIESNPERTDSRYPVSPII